jgi:hypothetical protein
VSRAPKYDSEVFRNIGGIAEGSSPAFFLPAIYPAKMAGSRNSDKNPDIMSGYGKNLDRDTNRDTVSRFP